MPTLGFLKKKRTKDSQSSIDPPTPTSPVKDNVPAGSPITKTTTASSSEQYSSSTSTPQTATDSAVPTEPPTPQKQADSMQAASYQQPYHPPAQQQQQQSAASIQNIMNPPQQSSTFGASNGQQVDQNKNVFQQGASNPVRETKGKYTLNDFVIQRTLGTGSFGRVHLVQSKHNQRFYAVKVLKKAQVVKMKQVEHTNDERRMLQKVKHPFLITLWGTFQDSKNLYMVMDFIEGGELFSLLRKSQVGFLAQATSDIV